MIKIKIKFLILLFVFLSLVFQTAFSQEASLKEIYAKKQIALKNLNIDELSKYMSADVISEIKKQKDPKAMMFLMNYTSPIEYTTGMENFNSSTATMEIKGKARNTKQKGTTENFNGIVNFKKEGNSWKVSREEFNFGN